MAKRPPTASFLGRIAAGISLIAAVSCFAADATTQPSTQPSAAAGDVPARVLVVPFAGTGPNAQPWIADAIQRALVSDLSRLPTISPAAADAPPAEGAARYVISGSHQMTDDNQIRIVGQIVDTVSNHTIAGLKSTGAQRDLFAMEDELSAQAVRALAQATGAVPAAGSAGSADANRVQPTGPIVMRPYNGSSLEDSLKTDSSTGTPGDYNRYTYGANGNYDYGGYSPYYGRRYVPAYDNFVDYGYYPQPYYYYPYNYGYGGSRIFIFQNNNFRRHGDGHDFHGHGGNRGFGSATFSVPSGTIVTPQSAARGSGHSNGYIPMTMQGGLRNYNGAIGNVNGAIPNANRGMPMTNRAMPMTNGSIAR